MSQVQAQTSSTDKTRLKSRSTVRTYLLTTPRVYANAFATAEVASIGDYPITQLGTTNESAAWGNIREGQTIWIGSAAGLCDRGIYWARFVQVAGSLKLGAMGRGDAGALTSDERTEIEVGDFITVWADHQLHAGRSRIAYTYGATVGSFFKLYDRAYSTQNSTPGPYFQGDTHKGYRLPTGSSTVAVTMAITAKRHKASQTVSTYSWTYPASFTGVSGGSTATLSASAPLGFHVCICRVTLNDASYEDCIRYIWVYNSTNVVELVSGSWQRTTSGVTYSATLADDSRGDIDPTAMCMVIEESTHAAGTVTGLTSKFIGYMQGGSASAQYGKRGSQISLVDPGQIIAALGNDSQLLEYASAPAQWYQAIAELCTIRYFIWYLLRWHIVNWNSLFCYYPDETSTQSNSPLKVNKGTVWAQIEDLAKRIAEAPIACDSDGDIHWGVIGSLTDPDSAARAALTLRDDSLDETTIKEFSYQEMDRPPTRVVVVGAFQWDGTTQNAIRSIAPAQENGQGAGEDSPPGMIINTQDDLDLLAGLIYGYLNRRVKTYTFILSGNYDIYEAAHRDRVYFNVPAAMTPDGVARAGYGRVVSVAKPIAPNGKASVTITVEPETKGSIGKPYPYPPASGGTGTTGGARPFGVRGAIAPKTPTALKVLPATSGTFGPSTAPNNKLAIWALAQDAAGSGFRVTLLTKTGSSTWQGRNISPTAGQRTTLGAPIKLIEMRRNVKGLILLCENGVAYTNDYTAKAVSWVIGWQANTPSITTFDFTQSDGGFTQVSFGAGFGTWVSGTGWVSSYGLAPSGGGTGGYRGAYIEKTLTSTTLSKYIVDYEITTGICDHTLVNSIQHGSGTILDQQDQPATGSGTFHLNWQGSVATVTNIIIDIFSGVEDDNPYPDPGGTVVITRAQIETTVTDELGLSDVLQSIGGNIYWLSKRTVSGTDYVYINYTRNNFGSIGSTQIAKYDSALTYNIQISDFNPSDVWASAGTTSDATAAIFFSSTGAVSFAAGAALNTRGGAFRLPRTLPGGNPNRQHKNIVYVKGISTNLQGVRDGSSAATISTGSADYPQTAQSLVSYFKDSKYVAVINKSRDLYLSSNGGQSWAFATAAPGTGNAYSLSGWYNNYKLLLAAGDQALAYSEDRGSNWTNLWSTYNTFRNSEYGGSVAQIILSAGFATYPTFTKPVL